jgi:beta-aspartyl-peptidase (threonine type)
VNPLAIIVHGGAWNVPTDLFEQCRKGAKRAVERGWAALQSGQSAIEACQEAVIELEEDPVFDAGIGSHLNRDGNAQLDAILMDGRSLKSGAVAAVERIRNPIRLARLVLENSEHMLLAGYGAEQFAHESGMELCDPAVFAIPAEVQRWSEHRTTRDKFGTVGAAALDRNGNIAAATSTGGTMFKYPGRIGDSPLVGCGCYADNEGAAVSATGHGESVMKIVMSKFANDLVAQGHSPRQAAEAAVAMLRRRTAGRGGLIVLDRQGRVGAAFSTNNLVHAYCTSYHPEATVCL